MPIIFNNEEKSFTLTDPSDEEKQAIFDIAVEQITEAFGKQIAKNILDDAAMYNKERSMPISEGEPAVKH